MSAKARAAKRRERTNRRNAQLSTGPRTPEGKQRSSLNGLRHGLTGQFNLMPHEDRRAFDHFCAGLLKDLAPAGDLETSLATSIAQDHWRLNRARAIEENVFALGAIANPVDADAAPDALAALTQAQTFLKDAPQLGLLTLYAQRLHRAIEKNMAALRQLQSERKAASQQALEEALLLAELNESQNLPLDEIASGFGFSTPELTRQLDRRRRLKLAKQLQSGHIYTAPKKTMAA